MSRWAMSGAANQVRQLDTNMSRLVSELTAAGVWSGADSDRFERDWYDRVRPHLLRAAQRMDNVHFEAAE
jgi:hypothetical protein